MDTSETYVKMCEKATEIQEVWEPAIGDYVLRRFTVFGEPLDSQVWPSKDAKEEITILHYHSAVPQYWHGVTTDGESRTVEFTDSREMVKATSICLFRQDQLQAMVISGQEVYMLLCDFGAWVDVFVRQPGDGRDYASMEQLWLAYVMWTKYKKRWTGSDWTK